MRLWMVVVVWMLAVVVADVGTCMLVLEIGDTIVERFVVFGTILQRMLKDQNYSPLPLHRFFSSLTWVLSFEVVNKHMECLSFYILYMRLGILHLR